MTATGESHAAIADMALARSEGSTQRFYSMSAQIRRERSDYYRILERTQKGGPRCHRLAGVVLFVPAPRDRWVTGDAQFGADKGTLRERFAQQSLNARQVKALNRLLDGFEGKLTTSKWAKLTKSSQDTAYRDILDLVERGALRKDPGGGRSTSYSLVTGDRR